MKKIYLTLLSILLVFSLVGCTKKENVEDIASDTVVKFCTALKNGDYEAAAKYGGGSVSDFDDLDDLSKKMMAAMFANLSIKIKSTEKISDTEVKVTADATNVDGYAVVDKFYEDLFTWAYSLDYTKEITEEEVDAKMIELIENAITINKDKTITITCEFLVAKGENDTWFVTNENGDDITDNLSGGFLSALLEE